MEHDRDHRFKARKGRDALDFLVRERLHQVKRPDSWGGERTDLEGTGDLQLVIDKYSDGDTRKRWSDGKRHRVEDLIGRALVSFDVLIERERVRREKHEEEELRRAEVLRRAEEQRKRLERQQKAVDALGHLIADWRFAEDLRAFLAKIDADPKASEAAAEWRGWAEKVAREVDPLSRVDSLREIEELTRKLAG